MNTDTSNEVLELSAKEIWKLINRSDREIRIIGNDGKKYYPYTKFWKTKEGKDSVTLEWTENNEQCGCDLNNEDFYPVEVIEAGSEYIIWWFGDIPIRFVFVQPSL
jgi:hypothetical protein